MAGEGPLEIVEYRTDHEVGVRRLSRARLTEEADGPSTITLVDDTHTIPRTYAAPDNRYLVALENGTVIGMGAIRKRSDTDCELTNLYVAQTHRRLGVASLVVGKLVPFVRERGYRRILLEIRPAMAPNKKIYRRYGFEDVSDPPRRGDFMAIHLG